MLADLADLDMPWAETTIYQVDERIGAADDPQRNLTGLRRALPVGCPARRGADARRGRRPRGGLRGLRRGAASHDHDLLTVARAEAILWLVTGSEKRAALARLLAGDPSIPASGVTTAEQVLFCDAEAVGDRGAPRVATEGN